MLKSTNDEQEEWMPRPDGYIISSFGRVIGVKGYILRPGIASNGYPTVSLRGITHTVHSLVAEAFLGIRPDGWVVCHEDGNRTNPKLTNLRYGRYKDNTADTFRHGRKCQGMDYATAKLTDDAVREIRKLKGKVPQSKLALLFNVSPAAIQAVHDGRTWTHVC